MSQQKDKDRWTKEKDWGSKKEDIAVTKELAEKTFNLTGAGSKELMMTK